MRTSASSSNRHPKWCDQLKELLAVRFDVSGKAKRVIACPLFRKLGITRFQRFDDSEMFGKRGGGAILASDRQLPITANVQQDVVGHIDQHRGFAERDQRLVKGDIGLGIFLDVILRQTVLAEIPEKV